MECLSLWPLAETKTKVAIVAGITWTVLQCYLLNSSNQLSKRILLSPSHRQASGDLGEGGKLPRPQSC